jgi:hypothetical protein
MTNRVVVGVVFLVGAVAGAAALVILGGRDGPLANTAKAEERQAKGQPPAAPARANYYVQHDWSTPRTRKLGKDQKVTLVMDANRVSRPNGVTYLVMVQFEGTNVRYFLTVDEARSLLAFYTGLKGKARAKSDHVVDASIQWRGRMLQDPFGEQAQVLSITYDYAGKFSHSDGLDSYTVNHLAAICELMPDVFKDLDALKRAPRSPTP